MLWVYLNYNNLDAATQVRLLAGSKNEVEQIYAEEFKSYFLGIPLELQHTAL